MPKTREQLEKEIDRKVQQSKEEDQVNTGLAAGVIGGLAGGGITTGAGMILDSMHTPITPKDVPGLKSFADYMSKLHGIDTPAFNTIGGTNSGYSPTGHSIHISESKLPVTGHEVGHAVIHKKLNSPFLTRLSGFGGGQGRQLAALAGLMFGVGGAADDNPLALATGGALSVPAATRLADELGASALATHAMYKKLGLMAALKGTARLAPAATTYLGVLAAPQAIGYGLGRYFRPIIENRAAAKKKRMLAKLLKKEKTDVEKEQAVAAAEKRDA